MTSVRIFQGLICIMALSSLTSLLSCKNEDMKTRDQAQTQYPGNRDRDPASLQDVLATGQAMFSQISQDAASTLHLNKLEELRKAQFIAEGYLTDFQTDLNTFLTNQEAGLGQEWNLVENSNYQGLVGMWKVTDGIENDVASLYETLHKVLTDAEETAVRKTVASSVITQIHSWLDQRPLDDKLMLAGLYNRLHDIEVKYAGDESRQPQSVGDNFSFKKYDFLSNPNLESYFRQEQKAIRAEVAKIHAKPNPWADQVAMVHFEGARMPSNLTKIAPSIGPLGNVFGLSWPTGTWVLTFDDGPLASTTEQLYPILQGYSDPVNPHGAPATFFVLERQAEQYPNTIKKALTLGYHLNDHSWTHPDLSKMNEAQQHHEVVDTIGLLKTRFSSVPGHTQSANFQFFRCPYGSCVAPKIPAVRQMIADNHLIHAFWNVDSLDWKNIGQPTRTHDLVLKQMQANRHGIILMHDIHASTIQAVPGILAYIKTRNATPGPQNVRLVTLEQALEEYNASVDKANGL